MSSRKYVGFVFRMTKPNREQREYEDESGIVWECIDEEDEVFETADYDEAIKLANAYTEPKNKKFWRTVIAVETVVPAEDGDGTVNIGTIYSRILR